MLNISILWWLRDIMCHVSQHNAKHFTQKHDNDSSFLFHFTFIYWGNLVNIIYFPFVLLHLHTVFVHRNSCAIKMQEKVLICCSMLTSTGFCCLFECRCLVCCLVALKVPPWPQRLLWEVPPHSQPEAVPFQGLPKCLWGHEAGLQPETEPYHPVRPEQRLCLLQRLPQTRAKASLLQPAKWPQAAAAGWCPGAPLHPLLGQGQSNGAAWIHNEDAGESNSRGRRAASWVTVWRLDQWWQERRAQPEAVIRRADAARTPGPQQRWM